MFEIFADDAQRVLKKYAKHLDERIVARAGVRAINKTATSASAALAKRLREEWKGLKAADIKKSISIKRAKAVKTLAAAQAELTVETKPIPLSKFAPRIKRIRTKRGARYGVTVKVNGKRELVPGGFFVRSKNGTNLIFRRVGRPRLPIMRVPGVSILGSVTDLFREEIRPFIRKRLATVLRQELNYETEKVKVKG